jgi:hypothetical protein
MAKVPLDLNLSDGSLVNVVRSIGNAKSANACVCVREDEILRHTRSTIHLGNEGDEKSIQEKNSYLIVYDREIEIEREREREPESHDQ